MVEFLNDAGLSMKAYFDGSYQGLQTIILTVFAGLNSIRLIAYVPQVMKAARCSNGASAISFTTWSLFFLSHLTTIFYAVVCLGDLVMATIFFGNALACLLIILVALRNRRQFHARKLEKA